MIVIENLILDYRETVFADTHSTDRWGYRLAIYSKCDGGMNSIYPYDASVISALPRWWYAF